MKIFLMSVVCFSLFLAGCASVAGKDEKVVEKNTFVKKQPSVKKSSKTAVKKQPSVKKAPKTVVYTGDSGVTDDF